MMAMLGLAGSALAAEVKWGDPVNGLRLGVESAVSEIPSDKDPTFTVRVQNVSDHAITIPSPDTFLPKPDRDFYKNRHQAPLMAVVKLTDASKTSPPVPEPPNDFLNEKGQPLQNCPAQVVTLAPGEMMNWSERRLERKYYSGALIRPVDRTSVQEWGLWPGGEYEVRFQFQNDQTEVLGSKVWTGEMISGAVPISVKPPSAKGIRLEGKFSRAEKTCFLGGPIEVVFTLTNKGKEPVGFEENVSTGLNRRGQRYTFTAVDAAGQLVPDTARREYGISCGAAGRDVIVKPGASYAEMISLNNWFLFPGPGKYVITCHAAFYVAQGDRWKSGFYNEPERKFPQVPFEEKLEITIKDDPSALKAYVLALGEAETKAEGKDDERIWRQLENLAKDHNADALEVFLKFLDGPPALQTRGVCWLSRYPNEQIAPLLFKRFSTLSAEAKQYAMYPLSQWNGPGVEALVAAALQDGDVRVRKSAVLICGGKNYESCVPILLKMGDDPDAEVRRELCLALVRSGSEQARPILQKLLREHDDSVFVRPAAAEALISLNRREGLEALMELLRDPQLQQYEAYAVQEMLKKITSEKFDNKAGWLDWWEQTGKTKEWEKS